LDIKNKRRNFMLTLQILYMETIEHQYKDTNNI